MSLSGLTHIFWSHVEFMISLVTPGSLQYGILNGLQVQIVEEFTDNLFVKDVLHILHSLGSKCTYLQVHIFVGAARKQ